MSSVLEADYLVVGAGATGMAFADAVLEHSPARVVLVDRRHAAGGHWRAAYPFVRLHQASAFYGAASTLLGGGRTQERGPEAGLQERAPQAEICAYYDRLLARLEASDRMTFLPASEHVGGRTVVSRVSGRTVEVPGARLVDAHFLAPRVPAETPPPFEVTPGVRVVPAGGLADVATAPRQFVVVGSGKTATDSVVWLLDRGVDPDAICWVRPREPWMMNRAAVQPDPAVFTGMVADVVESVVGAADLDEVFLRMEERGVMLRIDRTATPTMARAPTLATWELDRLRTVERVVRRGHLRRVEPGRLHLDGGSEAVDDDALVVHCAARGLRDRPRVPVWQPEAITVQPVRAGFPCFGAALIGYVEATRRDDAEKNRLCPPSPYGNSLADWAAMTVLGARAAASFGAEPDIREWSDRVALNPSRVPPGHPGSSALDAARERLARHGRAGLDRLASLACVAPS